MKKQLIDIFECLIKYANLTPDAIDDLYYIQGYIEHQNEIIDKIKEMILKVNDDEFYVNLSNKEKTLVDILELLEEIE